MDTNENAKEKKPRTIQELICFENRYDSITFQILVLPHKAPNTKKNNDATKHQQKKDKKTIVIYAWTPKP